MGRWEHRVGPSDVPGRGVPVSLDLLWFLAGILVGTFFGIGVTAVFAWKVVRVLVRFAVVVRQRRGHGGPDSGRAA